MGRTAGNEAYINLLRILTDAAANDHDLDMALAAVIAHELFHHGIGGSVGHRSPAGYVDSWPAIIGGVLSPEACKELCDELDID
jgi:hypothetical protein